MWRLEALCTTRSSPSRYHSTTDSTHTMQLKTVNEDIPLKSFSGVDDEAQDTITHMTGHGTEGKDDASTYSYSTNSTTSNLVGPGRVLGNFCSSAGKRLERTLGDIAQKAGFGPEAIYQKIRDLCLEDWMANNEKGEIILSLRNVRPLNAMLTSLLRNLCFKLFQQTK